MNKFVLCLLIALTVSLIPRNSISQANGPETVVLDEKNLLVLNTEVDGASTSAIIAQAKKLDAKLSGKKPMYLFLNTPGGSIQAGLELIEALRGIGRPINTVTLFAASMGFQIAQNLDDRLILKNGVLMSHRAAGQFEGSFGGSKPSQMDSRYQLWLDRVRELDEQTVKRTNGKQTYESYTKEYSNEVWLTGARSVNEGYADRIVLIKCGPSLTGTSEHHISFMGMDIVYELDNCPINTSPMNVRVKGDDKIVAKEAQQEVLNKFLAQFSNKQNQVVPMFW